jgi:hypothetical protein
MLSPVSQTIGDNQLVDEMIFLFTHITRADTTAFDGGDAWAAPAKPRPDETLIRALARAHR